MTDKIPEALAALDEIADCAYIPVSDARLSKARAAFAAEHAALKHCLAVFRSMADQGRYPSELMPDEFRKDSKQLFLGIQGWEFAEKALAAVEKLP